jgi:hypothetical protein
MIATPVSCDDRLGLEARNSSYRQRGWEGNVSALTLGAHGTLQSLATLSSLRPAAAVSVTRPGRAFGKDAGLVIQMPPPEGLYGCETKAGRR